MANTKKNTLDNEETLQVDDNVTLKLRPLKIFYLKKTIAAMNEMSKAAEEARKAAEAGDEEADVDEFLEINATVKATFEALQQDNSKVVDEPDWVEQNLSMLQINKVLQVCAGFEDNELGN